MKKNFINVLILFIIFYSNEIFSQQIIQYGPFLQSVETDLIKIRGLKRQTPIKFSISSRDEILKYIKERVKRQYSKRELFYEEKVLKDLGLIPQNIDYVNTVYRLLEEQVAGVYSPEYRKLYIANWLEGQMQILTIAHEYYHSIQDENFDIERFLKNRNNTDLQMAYSALIEGDATAVTFNYLLQSSGLNFMNLPDFLMEKMLLQFNESNPDSTMATVPQYLSESLVFPYVKGINFVKFLFNYGGWNEVNKALKDPPRSTEQILHPEKYFSKDEPLKIVIPPPFNGLKKMYHDTLGEFTIYQLLKMHCDEKIAMQASKGWGGDLVVVFLHGNSYFTVLFTEWDTDNDSLEFINVFSGNVDPNKIFFKKNRSVIICKNCPTHLKNKLIQYYNSSN